MSLIARLAGAIVAQTNGHYYLIGNTKEPCEWAKFGFAPPGEIDALQRPYLELEGIGEVLLPEPHVLVETEGELLAQRLAERLVIARSGSVSERLWRLSLQIQDEDDAPPKGSIDARWLTEVPMSVWRVVQDSVLRCV